jgi:hypothetical protein
VSSAAARAAFDSDTRATPIPVRAWRVIVVMFHIITIWLAAILVMPWSSRPRRDRIIERFANRMRADSVCVFGCAGRYRLMTARLFLLRSTCHGSTLTC